jgi:hypothetical protein
MKMILINVRVIGYQRWFSTIEYQKIILKFWFLKSNFSIENKNDYKFYNKF